MGGTVFRVDRVPRGVDAFGSVQEWSRLFRFRPQTNCEVTCNLTIFCKNVAYRNNATKHCQTEFVDFTE